MRQLFTMVCLTLLTGFSAFGQQYSMSTTDITDCSGFFFDPGGPNSDYPNNANIEQTICADGTGGTHVLLTFSNITLAAGDNLCFYDGTTTAAQQLACFTDFGGATSFGVQATAANSTGCLTLVFTSDGSGVTAGWEATMSCIAACQNIFADLVSSDPAVDPVDTGYIDICPGDRVLVSGAGEYPQNGVAYQHSDFTSTFEWQWGDGAVSYGPNGSHVFENPGGYIIQLYITDQFGCKNLNLLSQRVRVSTFPEFVLGPHPTQICIGDTINLGGVVNQLDTTLSVSVNPVEGSFQVEAIRSDSLPLPDGVGSSFATSITFSQFSPGQVLTDINDLVSICANMEHSWMHDLEISITCPNGTEVILHNVTNPNSTGTAGMTFLGEPNDPDNAGPNTINTPWGLVEPGIGYDYCWTPTSTNGTFREYADAFNPATLPAGDYEAFGNLTDLLGCPLNGDWTLSVLDNWGIDNGFIFNWSIEFAADLYPDLETFTPQIIDYGWNPNPSIISSTQTSIVAVPQNAGTANYVFTIENDFGCTFDTAVNITVLPFTHPDCYSCEGSINDIQDTTVCGANPSVLLDATFEGLSDSPVTFESYPDYLFGFANHPYNNPYNATIDVNSIFPNTVSAASIQSVCIDITTDFLSDIRVYLKAPTGQQLELTTNNGGGSDFYTNTCFTPTATTSVIQGAAGSPFTGNYIPEGNWANLNGATINGQWTLLVSDGAAPTKWGTLNRWSITFNTENIIDYTWTPATGLSCSDCETPVASPSTTTTYIVNTEDIYGCTHADTATVELLAELNPPQPYCGDAMNGFLVIPWDPVPNADYYLVSVNNGPWVTPTGATSHSVTGLNNFDNVFLQVQAFSNSGSCAPAIGSVNCVYLNCNLTAQPSNILPVTCPGGSNGQVFMSSFNGATPIFYKIDNGAFQSSTVFTNLTGGWHIVTVQDAISCVDTVHVFIDEPDAFQVSITTDSVNCNGGNDGTATVAALGGTGSLTYQWSTVPMTTGATITQTAGNYIVTVRDANNCTVTAVTTISQPPVLTIAMTPDSVQCFGQSNGSVVVTPSGGTPSYTYTWNVAGVSGNNLLNVQAGNYSVTVSDSHGCTTTSATTVLTPSELSIEVLTQPAACSGINNGSATTIVIGGTQPYTYSWSSGAGNTTGVTGLPSGMVTATVTDARGCTDNDTEAVLQLTPLNVIATSEPTQCFGTFDGVGIVAASGGTYPYFFTWDNGNPDSVATNLNAGDHFVIIQDSYGCRDTAYTTVTQPTQLTVSAQAFALSCSNSNNGTVVATSNGGTPNYTFVWSNTLSGGTLNNLAAGTYTVTATDANSCTTTSSTTVTAPAPIAITSVTTEPASCFGFTNGSITVQASGGFGTYDYVWTAPGQTSNIAAGLGAGTYTVTVVDDNNCTISASSVITQPLQLLTSLTNTPVSCFGGTNGTATVTVSGGTIGYQYDWANSQTTSTSSGLTAGIWTVTVTDANNCTAIGSTTINQPATAVSAAASQTYIGCFNQPQGQAVVTGSGGTPGYVYNWFNNTPTSNIGNLLAGTYTVTVTDANSCTATTSVTITELAQVVLTLAPTEPDCDYSKDGQIAVSSAAGGSGNGQVSSFTYQWSTFPTQFFATATNLDGNATYTVTATDGSGCIGTASLYLEEPSPIVLTVEGFDVKCFSEASGKAVATATSDVNNFNYQWSINSGAQQTDTASFLLVGTYYVTATDGSGCTATASVVINQPPALIIDEVAITPNKCADAATASINLELKGGTPTYTVEWSNGATAEDINTLTAGNYIATITDANGCILRDTFPVIDPDRIEAELLPENVRCFGGHDGEINIAAIGGTPPYQYSLDDVNYTGASRLVGLTADEYLVYVRDANGCIWLDTTEILTPEALIFDLGADETIFEGETIYLEPTTAGVQGAYDIFWDVQDDSLELTCYDCLNPGLAPMFTTIVTGIITDSQGCEDEDQITIFVYKDRFVVVPTGFTPDGNGFNDLLSVHGKSNCTIKTFRIFDRWGSLVFEDTDFNINDTTRGWNGEFNGKPMDPGTFVWFVEAEFQDGSTEVYKGNTTLIR